MSMSHRMGGVWLSKRWVSDYEGELNDSESAAMLSNRKAYYDFEHNYVF